MRRRPDDEYETDVVLVELGSHKGHAGWEELRVIYDFRNPRHQQQIDAVLDLLRTVRQAAAAQGDASTLAGAAS